MLKPHRPSDYPSLLLYVLDETHITVTLSTALAILYTRSAHVVWFAIGALTSSLSAKVLKEFIRHPRPPPPPSSEPSRRRPKRTYGMPSTHSSALTFYLAYLLPLIPTLPLSPFWRGAAGVGVMGYWAAGLWSRKALGYHTWEQVLGGAAWGVGLAVGWRGVWERYPGLGEGLQGVIDHVWRTVFG
ncbi:hypothetical protein IAT38_007322 [Cryptococcus sp. DSM 104549]